ncbi:MAG: serine/threonine protein kinase, partial [Deltaproteobacteria bacterium]|nr:serine/threonine protein kinase [Deltaproteobacteria bacterium]
MPDIGEVLGDRYRLEQPLGQGAMGTVWVAQHVELGSQHAIKVLKPEAAFFDRNLQRFLREARLMAKLQSAHVVRVTDHGYYGTAPFFVMEYLGGESLEQRLRTAGRLTIQDTATMVLHVARGLAQAHDLGLIHRDIKPANLFVTRAEADGTETFKILDFGIAKVTDNLTSDGVAPTETGALLGTPYYVSPEQARALKDIDFRADLWSLGVVAFQCLTGHRPFYADAVGPLLATIVHGIIPVASAAEPKAGLTPAIDAWMQRVLQREPTARFGSAMEMAEAFWAAAGLTLDRPSVVSPAVAQGQSTVMLDTGGGSTVPSVPVLDGTQAMPPGAMPGPTAAATPFVGAGAPPAAPPGAAGVPLPAQPYAPAATAGDPSFGEHPISEPPMAGPSKGAVTAIVAGVAGLLLLGGLGFGGYWWLTSDQGAETEETDEDDDDDETDESGGRATDPDTTAPESSSSA